MDFDTIELRRRTSGAWRLLSSDNAALTLSFLGEVFIEENVREISETDLVNRLDDELYALNQRLGETRFPKTPKSYLDDWSATDRGWLRRYYPHGRDEPHYDATAEVELAYGWVRELGPRDFIGTESRLATIIDLLRQMVHGADPDPEARRADLLRRREVIDAELAGLDRGEVEVLSPISQQDRYQQFAAMARELLADFRQVEDNFRSLDRQLRARIAGWERSKSELLDEALGDRWSIAGSPQGQTFSAFFDLLLSENRLDELSELLERVATLEALDIGEGRLRYVHHQWLEAGERTQSTVRLLSEQLRRFLDDQAWLENRRVMDLISSIQSTALSLRDGAAVPLMSELDATAPTVVLPMARPLYQGRATVELDSGLDDGETIELDSSVLFDQVYVDSARLVESVISRLRRTSQVDLAALVEETPVEHGVAEVVAYMSLRDPSFEIVFDDDSRTSFRIAHDDGQITSVTVPRVTYVRNQASISEQV